MDDGLRARWTELKLLILPVVFLALGLAMLGLSRPDILSEREVLAAVAVVGLFLATHVVLIWRLPNCDQLLVPITGMLSLLGLVMSTRLSILVPGLMIRQSLWIAVGLVLLVTVVVLLPDVAVLQSYKYTAALLGFLLMAATFVFGIDPNGSGARWWIGFGGYNFQPSEILKVLLVVFLAGYLEDKRELLTWSSSRFGWLRLPPLPYLGPLGIMWAVSMVLLIGQRDLGAALLFYSVFLAMLYVASSRGVYVWSGLLAFVVGAFVCYLAFAHVRLRVEVWLDPWVHARDQAYQIVQGLVALASGGIIGSGLGYGYPGYIPAVQTDFIIAAIGEELGLMGTLAVVALFLLLMYRGFRVAMDARRGFSVLLAMGLTAVLGIQAFVILAGTIKLTPLTGITLPFVSYGGSSIVTNFIIVGLLLRVSAEDGERHAT
jgi:cell division protein FtsW (lipid II flippase)